MHSPHTEHSLFRLVFERVCIGIALFAEGGRCLSANPYLCECLGRSPDAFGGRTLAALTHPEDRAAVAAALERLRRSPRREELRVRLLYQAGHGVWARLALELLAAGGVCQALDLGERSETELALSVSERRFRLLGFD